MTAEACEGQSESKRTAAGCAEGPGAPVPVPVVGGLKKAGREQQQQEKERRSHFAAEGRTGVGVLKTGLREDPKDIAEQIRRELDHQFAATDALRTPDSDGDGRRDDGAEDHYEEGDAAAAVACEKLPATKERAELPRVQVEGGGWETFLLQRNLRVLLVEDDDSTRHVVGALLRNCNYEGRYLSRFQETHSFYHLA